MAAATAKGGSIGARYAWVVFVVLGVLVVLIGVLDLSSGPAFRENAINELFIGLVTLVVAVGGLRRGQRWAWYAMCLWPLWVVAQGVRAWSGGKQGEALSGLVFLVVALSALAASYRRSFPAPVQRPT